MRRVLATLLLTVSFITVSASAAPRRDDDVFSRVRRVINQIVSKIVHSLDGGDTLFPPRP